jgi:hypothetical protein
VPPPRSAQLPRHLLLDQHRLLVIPSSIGTAASSRWLHEALEMAEALPPPGLQEALRHGSLFFFSNTTSLRDGSFSLAMREGSICVPRVILY